MLSGTNVSVAKSIKIIFMRCPGRGFGKCVVFVKVFRAGKFLLRFFESFLLGTYYVNLDNY